MFQRVNYGPVTHEENAHLADITVRERFTLWPAVVMTVVMGLAPMWFLRPMEPSVTKLVEQVKKNQGQNAHNPDGAIRLSSMRGFRR